MWRFAAGGMQAALEFVGWALSGSCWAKIRNCGMRILGLLLALTVLVVGSWTFGLLTPVIAFGWFLMQACFGWCCCWCQRRATDRWAQRSAESETSEEEEQASGFRRLRPAKRGASPQGGMSVVNSIVAQARASAPHLQIPIQRCPRGPGSRKSADWVANCWIRLHRRSGLVAAGSASSPVASPARRESSSATLLTR